MRLIILPPLLLLSFLTFSQSNNDSLLRELDKTLEKKEEYVQEKIHRIENYKASLMRLSETEKFDVYFKIYDEYKTFIYDSAFLYAKHLQNAAYHRKDPVSIDLAKLKLGF